MAKEINLLPEKEKRSVAEEALSSRLKKISFVFLGAIVVISACLLFFSQLLLRQIDDANRRQVNLEKMIANFREKEGLLALTKAKASGISSILSDRPDFVMVMDRLSDLMPPQMRLTELGLKKGKRMTIGGYFSDSGVLNTFINTLVDPQKGGKTFGAVMVDTISSEKMAGYRFNISFNYYAKGEN